jgi:hypothetical protein
MIYSSSFDSNRLITVDTISVDDHSRLTITTKLKKVLSIKPKDTITVYQDRYNKDLIFSIQHNESNTTDRFIIKRSSNTLAFHNTKTIEKHKEESISNLYVKKKDTLHDINILIVDDDEVILETFEFFLNSEGYHNVQKFSDSKKAVKRFVQMKKTDYYELAIIDIRMPVSAVSNSHNNQSYYESAFFNWSRCSR